MNNGSRKRKKFKRISTVIVSFVVVPHYFCSPPKQISLTLYLLASFPFIICFFVQLLFWNWCYCRVFFISVFIVFYSVLNTTRMHNAFVFQSTYLLSYDMMPLFFIQTKKYLKLCRESIDHRFHSIFDIKKVFKLQFNTKKSLPGCKNLWKAWTLHTIDFSVYRRTHVCHKPFDHGSTSWQTSNKKSS